MNVILHTISYTLLLWFVNPSVSQRFMASLVEATNAAKGATVLYIPSERLNPTSPADDAKDASLVQRLEACVIHWTRQIKSVTTSRDWGRTGAIASSSVGASNPEASSDGPLAQIAFWSARSADLVGVSTQLISPPLLAVLAVLREAKSAYLGPFETLRSAIQAGNEEAADNVKVLSLLRPSCEALSVANLDQLPALLPEVLARVRVIGNISRHYCTPDHLSGLVASVSAEVIRRCAAAVDTGHVLDSDVPSAIATLHYCMAVCAQWKEQYEATVEAVRAHPGQRGLYWSWDPCPIFAPIDAFVQRCREVLDVCEGQLQFALRRGPGGARLPLPVFGGAHGPDTSRSLIAMQQQFEGLLSILRYVRSDMLDVRSARWHDAYAAFKSGLRDLDVMASKVIAEAFVGVTAVEPAAALLTAFHSLAVRDAVRQALDKRAAAVFTMFSSQVATAKVYFESHISSPPLPESTAASTHYAGPALWARGLASKIEADWAALLPVTHFLPPTTTSAKAASEAAEAVERLSSGVEEYCRQRFAEWTASIAGLDQNKIGERLAIPLLARCSNPEAVGKAGGAGALSSSTAVITKPKHGTHLTASLPFLRSNFDAGLAALLEEVAAWEQFSGKYVVPFFASELSSGSGEALRVLRAHVLALCGVYNEAVRGLDELETRLFGDALRRLDRKLGPGLSKVTWATKGARDLFVKEVARAVTEVSAVITAFQAERVALGRLVDSIRSTRLLDFQRNHLYDPSEFSEAQGPHAASVSSRLGSLHQQVRS